MYQHPLEYEMGDNYICERTKKEDKKTSEVGPNNVNLATMLARNFDMTDTTAGLTINSDVATLNSKGMDVRLDNSADVAKMIAEPVIEQVSASQKDQTAARASFESTFGDLRAEMAKQKATDDLLLAAVQELIRVQKTGVEVQQKIYQATA